MVAWVVRRYLPSMRLLTVDSGETEDGHIDQSASSSVWRLDSDTVTRRIVAACRLPTVMGCPVRVVVRFRDHGAGTAADGGPPPRCFSGPDGIARRRRHSAIPALQSPG